nr:EAL domain-containing protein [Noviherbaspirillum saxi]
MALQSTQYVLPDLVLLDVRMPNMNGYEICERLKKNERTRNIPVIFISAADQELDKLRAFASGGIDYIVRPLFEEEVLARIRTHLSLRKLQKNLEELVQERTAELIEANAKLKAENRERQQAEERIRYMAHYDALTGLPNRILLQDRIAQAIAYAHRNSWQMAVLLIDLDYFKHINDSLGHYTGDQLLKLVSQRLRQSMREGDSLARLGGDEFVLCIRGDSKDAAHVAGKIISVLDQAFIVDDCALHVGASIGISQYPNDGDNAEALMRAADSAMYHAKENGRKNYQFFSQELNQRVHQRLHSENLLRQAWARREFSVHYQPQVDMESGKIFSAEALLRWHPPGKSPMSCGPYMTIAEETGLILPIGEWVLHQACRDLKRWHSLGYPDLHIAVNLSPRQFTQGDLVDTVAKILQEYDIPPGALELEITESVLLQCNDGNTSMLKQLSDLGVQLSIDDFGTGYSNLGYLQRFPVHALKIDRLFVNGIGQNANDTALISAIIAMAHSLQLKVLAEGVETAEQTVFLLQHGCLAAQGFYYSEAVSADVFPELLRKQTPSFSGYESDR